MLGTALTGRDEPVFLMSDWVGWTMIWLVSGGIRRGELSAEVLWIGAAGLPIGWLSTTRVRACEKDWPAKPTRNKTRNKETHKGLQKFIKDNSYILIFLFTWKVFEVKAEKTLHLS